MLDEMPLICWVDMNDERGPHLLRSQQVSHVFEDHQRWQFLWTFNAIAQLSSRLEDRVHNAETHVELTLLHRNQGTHRDLSFIDATTKTIDSFLNIYESIAPHIGQTNKNNFYISVINGCCTLNFRNPGIKYSIYRGHKGRSIIYHQKRRQWKKERFHIAMKLMTLNTDT